MCGIVGFWSDDGIHPEKFQATISKMTNTLTHRGPDDVGVWVNDKNGIALGQRRLSILDLSAAGHQPMISENGRYVVVFNGEIYNHLSLRKSLLDEGAVSYNWHGQSDTETLLAGIEHWGIVETLKKLVGMFAIGIWDYTDTTITLARDRIGEKPLYYGFQKNTLLFGSELKALKPHKDFAGEINRNSICLYLRHSYVPTPHSIFNGIKKLPPGTLIQFPLKENVDTLKSVAPMEYWSLAEVANTGLNNPFKGSDAEAVELLDKQIRDSVKLQMMADVPLGVFLSGGIDSSLITSLMQAQSVQSIKTFSIGFESAEFNEAIYANAIAKHLGTDHTELYVTSEDAMQVIPLLGKIYDEPFSDSSQIPTYLVSKLAKTDVTVALSGDGGDELFCGYNSAFFVDQWKYISKIPYSVRKLLGDLIRCAVNYPIDALIKHSRNTNTRFVKLNERLTSLANRLNKVDSVDSLIYSLASVIDNPEDVVLGAQIQSNYFTDICKMSAIKDIKPRQMFLTTKTYLPDDILVKVDRAAMANSLETRMPLLDHRVIEMAWGLPMLMKIRNGEKKWILKQVLNKYVPNHLFDRSKSGFSIPLAQWLRGPLKAWAEDLLNKERLVKEGYFDVEYIHEKWVDHQDGVKNNQTFLWSILMFEMWLLEQ